MLSSGIDPEVRKALELRLARGEITVTQFREVLETLGGPASSAPGDPVRNETKKIEHGDSSIPTKPPLRKKWTALHRAAIGLAMAGMLEFIIGGFQVVVAFARESFRSLSNASNNTFLSVPPLIAAAWLASVIWRREARRWPFFTGCGLLGLGLTVDSAVCFKWWNVYRADLAASGRDPGGFDWDVLFIVVALVASASALYSATSGVIFGMERNRLHSNHRGAYWNVMLAAAAPTALWIIARAGSEIDLMSR